MQLTSWNWKTLNNFTPESRYLTTECNTKYLFYFPCPVFLVHLHAFVWQKKKHNKNKELSGFLSSPRWFLKVELTQFVLDGLQDAVRVAEHARRCCADLNEVLPHRLALKHGIKRRHFVHPHRSDAQHLGNLNTSRIRTFRLSKCLNIIYANVNKNGCFDWAGRENANNGFNIHTGCWRDQDWTRL